MNATSAFGSAVERHRHRIHACVEYTVARGMAHQEIARTQFAEEIAAHCDIDVKRALLIVEASLSRVAPRTAPPRPTTASAATDAQLDQHSPPATCWFCDQSSWWRAQITAARWLCARCSPPDHDDAIVWHDATAPELADAKREPRWTEAPDRDDYLFLRIRKLARKAARTAADLLGAWRPSSPRTTADLRIIDWHAITDACAIIAAAEELNAWALDQDVRARVIACRALAATIGWPVRAIAPVLDRALDLLRSTKTANGTCALGANWPQVHALRSADPVRFRIDASTSVYMPAHPHLLMLLRGINPVREARDASRPKGEVNISSANNLAAPAHNCSNVDRAAGRT